MPKFPKTRILVGNEIKFSVLFSLKENNDGTVNIFARSGYWMTIQNSISKIEAEHISIHPSFDSIDKITTIKNTIFLENRKITYFASIDDSRESLVWPIYTKCTADLSNDDFHYKSDNKNEIKIIISNKINKNFSMLYSIFVQRKNGHFPEIENFSLQTLNFKEFIIGIYFTYLLIPPTLAGVRASIATGPARINGVSSNHNLKDGRAASYEVKHLKDLLYVCCEQAARNQTRIYLQDFLRDPIYATPVIIDIISSNFSTISKDQIIDFYNPKIDYLPWICDLMQIDDSKEFKKALRLVWHKHDFSNHLPTSSKSYRLTNNSFGNIDFKGLLSKTT